MGSCALPDAVVCAVRLGFCELIYTGLLKLALLM